MTYSALRNLRAAPEMQTETGRSTTNQTDRSQGAVCYTGVATAEALQMPQRDEMHEKPTGLTVTVHATREFQRLERSQGLLAHLAPCPPALDQRLAPCLQTCAHGNRAHNVQLALFRGEVRLACLQLALRGGKLRTNGHLRLDEAEGGRGRRGEERVTRRFLVLRRFYKPCHTKRRIQRRELRHKFQKSRTGSLGRA